MSEALPISQTPRERIEIAVRCLERAAAGEHPLWTTVLALEYLWPLLDADPAWRADNADLLMALDGATFGAIPPVTAAMGERFGGERTAIAMASVVVLLRDEVVPLRLDRIAYVRILYSELIILLNEQDVASRGDKLLQDVRGQLRFLPPEGAPVVLH